MTRDEMAVMKRRLDGYDRKMRKLFWFWAFFSLGCQVPGIALAFLVSWQRGAISIVQSVAFLLIFMVPAALHAVKTRKMVRASTIVASMVRTLDHDGEDDPEPRTDPDGLDRLMLGLVVLQVTMLVWGTPENKWRDGTDPYHSHPDDRRRRLADLLTLAAWAPLSGVPWFVRIEMIAIAQICIAAEAVQSRSLSGRMRNAWLRLVTRREPDGRPRHVVPVEAETA